MLRLEPNHSLALGALGTILTQQGRFQHAWDILDARVRPPLSAKDLRAAKEREASGASAATSASSLSSSRSSSSSSSSSEEATLSSSSSEEAPSSTGADSKETVENREQAADGVDSKYVDDISSAAVATATAADDVAATDEPKKKQPWWKFGGRFARKSKTNEPIVLKSNAKVCEVECYPQSATLSFFYLAHYCRVLSVASLLRLFSRRICLARLLLRLAYFDRFTTQAKDASAASSDRSHSRSSTEEAAANSAATTTATVATATAATTAPATPPSSSSSSSSLSSSSLSLPLPEGISAPELVAWARLAPRFGCGSSAIVLLRAYLDQQALEAAEVADFELDADVSDELQRHQGLNDVSTGGRQGAEESYGGAVEEGGAVEGQVFKSPVVKASIGARKQLEANMRFRLAGL